MQTLHSERQRLIITITDSINEAIHNTTKEMGIPESQLDAFIFGALERSVISHGAARYLLDSLPSQVAGLGN